MRQELNFDGCGINLKEFDEKGDCVYCERVATMTPRFTGHKIGKLLAMTMVMSDTLKVAANALNLAEITATGPDHETIVSAYTLAQAIYLTAEAHGPGERTWPNNI